MGSGLFKHEIYDYWSKYVLTIINQSVSVLRREFKNKDDFIFISFSLLFLASKFVHV